MKLNELDRSDYLTAVHVFTHPTCLLHDPGPTHPESPWRLHSLLETLIPVCPPWVHLRHVTSQATAEQLTWVHRPAYVSRVLDYLGKRGRIDPETILSKDSVDAALWAAGGAMGMVDVVDSGDTKTAWLLGRPPGHHAESHRGMGFCVLNNVALAARYALKLGRSRVAILDIDVHHGNGTQDIFWNDPNVLFISTHQRGLYPAHTGAADERGGADAMGTNVNIPLPAGAGDALFLSAWTEVAQPVINAFRPELLLVSAGFDAHINDPLGGLNVTEMGYARFCLWLQTMADRWSDGKSLWIWEGGYDGQALKDCFIACLNTWKPDRGG